jgi:hypothetical protein
LWSVHDFKAYDIFNGWSVHRELTCPICGLDIDCFYLTHRGKTSYFNCHRCWLPQKHDFRQEQNTFQKDTTITKGPPKHLSSAQIIDMLDKLMSDPERPGYFEGYGEMHNWTHKCALWELPYMPTLILMHNIDVMHQEHNMGESIISTYMSFLSKTKDNRKARWDLAELCNRSSLELKVNGGKSCASFCLKPQHRKEIMRRMKGLKFPDGYATGLRRPVNMATRKLIGLKSHDYHIIVERLLPIMFQGYFDDVVWMVLAELSYFYTTMC